MGETASGVARVLIEVLGPLTVVIGRRTVPISAPRPRIILVMLALSAGEPVLYERLATALWEQERPKDARRALQLHMTRLRKVLKGNLIRTVPGGYLLATDPQQVDAVRFGRLLDAARLAGHPDAERAMLVEALSLWKGEPFDGMSSAWLERVEMPRLLMRRLAALERRIELDLAAGRTGGIVEELEELTAGYPLREQYWGYLMTALAQAGRRADALETYQRLYRLLAEELGIEPSRPLRALHSRILNGEPAVEPAGYLRTDTPIPVQLPASVGYFTGRNGALARLDRQLPGQDRAAPAAVAVTGAAGIGKTALAVHWAWRVAGHFPDGQVFVDLRGFDSSGTPLPSADAIRRLLDALGVAAQRVPADPEAQVGLYRTLLAGKRILVVLDNARDGDQVRPLLPGAAGCLAVVTSRDQLAGLVAHDGAQPLQLDLLTGQEALQLLTIRLGAHRIAAEPQAVQDIIGRCGRHPLALNNVAARAVRRPGFALAALAAELRDCWRRLDTLSGADPLTDLRTVFTTTYRTLPPDAARIFRLLGRHPGPDTSAAAIAGLTSLPVARVRASLATLADLHLIVEHQPGRYTFDRLLRAYAAELAGLQAHPSSVPS